MNLNQYNQVRRIAVMTVLLILLLPMVAWGQMPVRNPAWVQVNPWFEGAEAIYSSATVTAYNYYGNYWLDVTALPPGIGIWEPAVNPRTGNPVAELIPVHQGREVLIYDWTSTNYLSLMYDDTVDFGYYDVYEAGAGVANHVFHGEAGFEVWVMDGGFALSVANPERLFMYHDGTEGVVGTAVAGNLQLNAFADVYTLDDVGIGIAAPTEALHVVGNPRFVTGAEGVGTIWGDDGTGTGVGEWLSQAQLSGGIWFLYDTASADVAGYDTLFADPSVGGVQSYNIAIPASPTLIEEFATEIGEPGITFIQDGILTFHFHARRSAGTMNARVYAEIYTRTHPVGIETLIATTEVSNELTNVQAAYEVHATIPYTALAVTDRLVVKVYGNQYPPGANPTIQFYVEGTTATRIELPGAEGGTGMGHIMIPVPVNGAEPTQQILVAGVSEDAMDFFVDVNCHDLNSDTVWPALGSRFPVASLITYYWAIDAGNLTVFVINDSSKDVMAMVWWGK